MIKADNYDIKYELDFVFQTKDGKKFIDVDKAIKHQKKLLKK